MRKRKVKIPRQRRSSYEYTSPIPPHLTPAGRAEWEKELEWEQQELERRKAEGFYKY